MYSLFWAPKGLSAESMQGNSLDLQALLDWVRYYFGVNRDADGAIILDANGDPTYEHVEDFREEIYGAVLRFYTAFETVEKSYRTAFGTTGAKKKDDARIAA
ncbi:hypothetical protein DL765_003261 [Monosporascus sp. GIB2]|nr:hypothetical protein DL765_003261 [Monosporascus sp. GIB2]